MKPLFLITSALNPTYGVFSPFDRYTQTMDTIKSIREKVPEADIFLVDVSVNEVDPNMLSVVMNSTDYFMSLSTHPGMIELSKNRAQSQAETLMTLLFLETIKEIDRFKKYDRIFKITGRIQLDDGFDINRYNDLHGKFVFKNRVQTWMPTPYRNATHLYDTRLYSLCTSKIDTFIEVLKSMFDYLQFVDFEHAMYANIPNELVVEFERVYCKGQVASSGEWKYD